MSLQNHGTATTDGFLLNEATLMLGPLGEFLDLTVEEHSIGLFKNLQINHTLEFAQLTQGVRQSVVGTTITQDSFAMTGSGYEFTPRQLAYQLGGLGYEHSVDRVQTTTTSAASLAAATTVTVASATNIPVGAFVTFGGADARQGLIYKVESKAGNVLTLDRGLIKDVASGVTVYVMQALNDTASQTCGEPRYMSAKVVSSMPNCDPIILFFPKVQVTSGLNIQFGVGDYSAQNFELQALDLLPNEAGYDWVQANGGGRQMIPFNRKHVAAAP